MGQEEEKRVHWYYSTQTLQEEEDDKRRGQKDLLTRCSNDVSVLLQYLHSSTDRPSQASDKLLDELLGLIADDDTTVDTTTR